MSGADLMHAQLDHANLSAVDLSNAVRAHGHRNLVRELSLMALRHCPEWSPASLICPMQTARFACKAAFDHVRLWHKADILNAITTVRFWGQSGH